MSWMKSLGYRRAAWVVVVFFAALACGYLMQNVLTQPVPMALNQDPPAEPKIALPLEDPDPFPTLPTASLEPNLVRPPILPSRATEPRDDDGRPPSSVGCDPRLFLAPSAAAMVDLTLQAPCHANTLVKLTQGPLIATQRTNDAGHLHVRLPALEAETTIHVAFAGLDLKTNLRIPDADRFQHIALMWEGPQVLRMNAFEFGAARNEVGHVWSGAPKSPNRASNGTGGYLTRLVTEGGPSAEIYSLPAGRSPMRGVVRLVVEADITKESCGRIVKAKAFQPTAFRRFSQTDVEVALPDCDRQGEVVLLQNLLRDVRLAGR